MRTVFLETILTFDARPHVRATSDGEKVEVFDERYRTVELPCGCQNITTRGGGDGRTTLCDAHGIPEDSDDPTYYDFVVVGEESWAVYSDQEVSEARAAMRTAGISETPVYRSVEGETVPTGRVITAEEVR